MISYRGKDFRKEAVKGRDFTGSDLSGADFRGCDLTGAKFDDCVLLSTRFDRANLTAASFERSRMGRRWLRGAVVQVIGASISTALCFAGGALLAVLAHESISGGTEDWWGPRLGLLMALALHAATARYGARAGVAVFAGFAVFAGVTVVAGLADVAVIAGVAVIALGAVGAGVAGGAVVAGFTGVAAGAGFAGVALGAVFVGVSGVVLGEGVSGLAVVFATLWLIALLLILGVRARRNHPGFEWFHDRRIRTGAYLGTSFRNADLTSASFSAGSLTGSSFTGAKLVRTRWTSARSMEKAWLDARWRDPVLREVLITGQAEGLDLSNRNLMGVDLSSAHLAKANLAHADLTGATFANADLRDANLSETQALGADFQGADLTGACLRDWNIDKSTRLEGVRCRYFFLSETENANGHRDRRPHDPDREFAPGDFQKLFTHVQETIELLIRQGVDRASFSHALQSMMTLYPETRGAIRSVEQVDGDLIVRIHATPETDAIGVEQAFYSALGDNALEAKQTPALLPASPTDAVLLPALRQQSPARIFISYAHKDDRLVSSFRDHLAVLRHNGMAEVWDDRRIPAGEEWEAQIDDRLAQAGIILLLISPAFIASDYCFKRELPAALARRPEAAVIPIVVEPCDFEGLPFDKLQMPRQGKPITEARNRNAAWQEVVRDLRKVIASRNTV